MLRFRIIAGTGLAAFLCLGAAAAPSSLAFGDRDGDGMPNRWELNNGLNPDVSNGNHDLDDDRLRNIGEYRAHTKPGIEDTDGDGLDDGDEVKLFRTDPLNPDENQNAVADGDENGSRSWVGREDADDSAETCRRSDDDTDGDGLDDEDENDHVIGDRDDDDVPPILDSDSDDDGIDDGDDDSSWHGYRGSSLEDDEDEDDYVDDNLLADRGFSNDPCPGRDEELDDREQNLVQSRLVLSKAAAAMDAYGQETGSYAGADVWTLHDYGYRNHAGVTLTLYGPTTTRFCLEVNHVDLYENWYYDSGRGVPSETPCP